MRRLLLVSLLIFLLLVGFVLVSHAALKAPDKLVLACATGEDFPMQLGDTEIRPGRPGVAIEFFQLLEPRIHLKVEIIRLPWNRCLQELGQGTVDGIFYAAYKPEREAIGVYPMKKGKIDKDRRFNSVTYALYRLKNSSVRWDGKKMHYLKGSLGVTRGYVISDTLEKMGYNIEVTETDLANLKKLAARRIEAFATLEHSSDALLHDNPGLGSIIAKENTPIMTTDSYLMLSRKFVKKYPALSELIWNTVRDLRKTEYERLLRNYLR